jgi:alkanesulfonate monooxygenase SsuD/methylene tetrahydromethanopterin reductase-like flavin-dependent oxidoreductase (luciferase family)
MRGAAGEGVSRAFGVTAGLDEEIASPLADRCQELGYHSMWSNDHPGAKGLETVADYAKGADRIELGVAVIARDRQSPEEIASDIERLGIDKDRLWLGLGAGFTEKPLTTMHEALPALREALPGIRLVLAAMGPKMCAFAGAEWDGVFFNWITPEFAARARGWVEEGASEAGREPPTVFGYVRTAVGGDAEGRLAKDESFYRDMHQGYRRHFDRQGAPEGTVGVAGENESGIQAGLARYRALDVTVVRALASATIEDMSALAEAAAPGD